MIWRMEHQTSTSSTSKRNVNECSYLSIQCNLGAMFGWSMARSISISRFTSCHIPFPPISWVCSPQLTRILLHPIAMFLLPIGTLAICKEAVASWLSRYLEIQNVKTCRGLCQTKVPKKSQQFHSLAKSGDRKNPFPACLMNVNLWTSTMLKRYLKKHANPEHVLQWKGAGFPQDLPSSSECDSSWYIPSLALEHIPTPKKCSTAIK